VNETETRVNWRLTIRAALVITAVSMALFGVLSADQIDCRVCWRDQVSYFFGVFGYFAGFGYAIGWTLPPGPADTPEGKHTWNTRQGFWEGSLGLGALVSCAIAAYSLFGWAGH
jgi:hypothetical protein